MKIGYSAHTLPAVVLSICPSLVLQRAQARNRLCPKAHRVWRRIGRVERGQADRRTGMVLAQPLVVQVNDEQGTAVTGALVEFSGPAGVSFDPPSGLTDSSGQLSTNVALGGMAGRYQLTARTFTKAQKSVELKIEEIALGYQQQVGGPPRQQILLALPQSRVHRGACFQLRQS